MICNSAWTLRSQTRLLKLTYRPRLHLQRLGSLSCLRIMSTSMLQPVMRMESNSCLLPLTPWVGHTRILALSCRDSSSPRTPMNSLHGNARRSCAHCVMAFTTPPRCAFCELVASPSKGFLLNFIRAGVNRARVALLLLKCNVA